MARFAVEIPDELVDKLKSDSGEPAATLCRVAAFFSVAGNCPRVKPPGWRG
jgi:hypothetical protein